MDNEAYKRFLASAPTAQREYRTIELYHSTFVTPLRFLQGFVDKGFILEATAPRNAGETVNFDNISIEITEPQESKENDPVLTVNMGGIGLEVQDKIQSIIDNGSFEPIECIYRKYYSGDLTEPVVVLTLSVSGIRFESYRAVAFSAEDIDFANKQSGEKYTLERFPMLSGL